MGAIDKSDVEDNEEEIIQVGFNFYHLVVRLQDLHGTDEPIESREGAW